MISPSKQKVIQIEVTNACPHMCGNCTRFSGHHKKPFFMEVPDFKRAVNSLQNYPGMVGVMGGEPTIHPKFDELVKYIAEKRGDKLTPNVGPIRSFVSYRNKRLANIKNKIGLWTSLGGGYAKHYELIQDSFPYQCVNDHTHRGEHMALMLPREELGIKDEEWVKLRDDCWVQREWSSSITPKGAFFCEVAAALDMLFDGPGGWPVEPGWWKREPKDFGDQLKWCELCSACLAVPHVEASSQVDVVSPKMHKRLEEIGSPKIKKGLVKIFDTKTYDAKKYSVNHDVEPYVIDNKDRVANTNKSLNIKSIDALIVCVNYDDYLELTLPTVVSQVDRVLVVTDKNDKRTKKVCDKYGAKCIVSKRLHENGAKFAKGKAINEGLEYLKPKDWVLLLDADVMLKPNFRQDLNGYILNPGALYYTKRWGPADVYQIPSFTKALKQAKDPEVLFNNFANTNVAQIEGREGNDIEHLPFGYFQLFNIKAQSVKAQKTIYPETSDTAEHDDKVFGFEVFPVHKKASLPVPKFSVMHLPHGIFQTNWKGRKSPRLEAVFKNPMAFKPVPGKFRCINTCTLGGRMYRPGDIYSGYSANKHFEVIYAS